MKCWKALRNYYKKLFVLEDYHFCKNSLQWQICLSHKSVCLLSTPLALPRSHWEPWKRRGGCCQLVLSGLPSTWNLGNAPWKSDTIPKLLVHFPQEDCSEFCKKYKATCQILFSVIYGCFIIYMCHFFTTLK